MYDSTAKFPTGVLNGNVLQYGDFDQCLDVVAPQNVFRGKYCLLAYNPSWKTKILRWKILEKRFRGLIWLKVNLIWWDTLCFHWLESLTLLFLVWSFCSSIFIYSVGSLYSTIMLKRWSWIGPQSNFEWIDKQYWIGI